MSKHIREFKSNYTVVHNEFIDDKNLQNAPVGLLLRMLRKPVKWKFTIKGLMKMCNEGERRIRSELDALEKEEYVARICRKSAYGRIVEWEYMVSDEHLPEEFVMLGTYYRKQYNSMADAEKPVLHFADVEDADVKNVVTYQVNKEQVNNNQVSSFCKSESKCINTEDNNNAQPEMTDKKKHSLAVNSANSGEKNCSALDRDKFKEQIDYDRLIADEPEYADQINSVVDIVSKTFESIKGKVKVSKRYIPREKAVSAFSKLEDKHIMYVISKFNKQKEKQHLHDPSAYMLTMLYNASHEYSLSKAVKIKKHHENDLHSFDISDIQDITPFESIPSFTLEDIEKLANNFDDFI